MLYEEQNPPPPKKCNPFPLIFQIIALIIFFKAPSCIQDAYFFILVFGGGTLLGFIVGEMVNGDI